MTNSTPRRKTLAELFPTLDFTTIHPRKKEAVAELKRLCEDYPEFQFDESNLCVVAECASELLKVRADFDFTEAHVYQAQRISFCPEVVTSSEYVGTPDDALVALTFILAAEAKPVRIRRAPKYISASERTPRKLLKKKGN